MGGNYEGLRGGKKYFVKRLEFCLQIGKFTALQHGGPIAQLGERNNGIVEVVGSIPIGSTIRFSRRAKRGLENLMSHRSCEAE